MKVLLLSVFIIVISVNVASAADEFDWFNFSTDKYVEYKEFPPSEELEQFLPNYPLCRNMYLFSYAEVLRNKKSSLAGIESKHKDLYYQIAYAKAVSSLACSPR